MRKWLTILLLAGCGSDSAGADENLRCEQGPSIAYQALRDLVSDSPNCASDDECVLLPASVECKGLSIDGCPYVVHRDVVDAWDEDAVCARIEKLPGQSDIQCSIQASCVAAQPACVQGRCSGR